MKLSYDTPTIEIVKFQADDIIITSLSDGDPGGIIPEMPWEPWP